MELNISLCKLIYQHSSKTTKYSLELQRTKSDLLLRTLILIFWLLLQPKNTFPFSLYRTLSGWHSDKLWASSLNKASHWLSKVSTIKSQFLASTPYRHNINYRKTACSSALLFMKQVNATHISSATIQVYAIMPIK